MEWERREYMKPNFKSKNPFFLFELKSICDFVDFYFLFTIMKVY